MERPVSTGELVVLVVANSAEDHSESLVTGDLAGGLEVTIGITLDERSVRAVADVAPGPAGACHVGKLVVGFVVLCLDVLDVAGVDAVDDRSNLSAGDVTLGVEGAVLVALENAKVGENFRGFRISLVDVLDILKGCVSADGQGQSHDQSQHHCE